MKDQQNKQEGIPHMDELAMRLQVPPQEEPYHGVVLFGNSGRAYSMVELMYNLTTFVAQSLQYMISINHSIQEVSEGEPDQRSGQPEKTDNTTGDTESN